MTWQDKEREAYETRLRERWTPDGERIYRANGQVLRRSGVETKLTLPKEATVGWSVAINSEWKEDNPSHT